MSAPLALVAAIAKNGVIGARAGMPWRLPSDLKRFRAVTLGKPLLMGRKTFQSIGRALPGRETIILTRDRNFDPAIFPAKAQEAREAVHIAHDFDEALALAQERAAAMRAEEVIVAGGGEIYEIFIGRAARMHLTFVDLEPEGEARFPPIDWSDWIEERRIAPEPTSGDEARFVFADFSRR